MRKKQHPYTKHLYRGIFFRHFAATAAVANDRRDRGGERKSLLFFHGFMGSGKDFEQIVHRENGAHDIYLFDLPGHGQSASWDFHAVKNPWEKFAEDILALEDHFSIQHPVYIGYSMGGRLLLEVLRVKLKRPLSAIAGVFLESVGFRPPQGMAEKESRWQQDCHLLDSVLAVPAQEKEQRALKWREFLESWYRAPLFAGVAQHPHFEQLLRARAKNSVEVLNQVLRAFSVAQQADYAPVLARLAEARIPLLYLSGSLDQKYSALSSSVRSFHPKASVHTASGCSHAVHFQNPDLFQKVLAQFLSSVS